MAVDSLRDTYHVNRVSPSDIGELLSAQSYRLEVTQAIRLIKSWWRWGALQDICANKISPGPHPVYADQGYPCLKTKNVSGLIVTKDELDWVETACAEKLVRFSVHNEDLLLNLTGAGSIGRTAIYFGEDKPLTNQHVARLKIIRPHDAAYVCCFLSTWWGERSIEQGISGSTGQLNLVNDHIRKLPVILPDEKAQAYIGEKVRQAERLRERAREDSGRVEQLFTEAGLTESFSFAKQERVSPQILGNRLDAIHYRKDLLESFKRVKSFKTIRLGDKSQFQGLSDGDHGNPVYGVGPLYIRASEMSGHRFDGSAAVMLDSSYATRVSKSCWASAGDVVFSIVGTLGLVVVLNNGLTGIMSRGVAKVRPLDLSAHYVKAFMRTPCFAKELLRQSVGTIQRGVYLEALSEILIPLLDEGKIAEIAKREERADAAHHLSNQLTQAARLLVEALIEGKISEEELKQAQEALECGDNSLDGAILARLTRKGIDEAKEPPLFADLDALYDAIAQTSTADEEKESQ